MTIQRLQTLRAAYPRWMIWQLGERWWAKRKASDSYARADDPDELAQLITEHDELAMVAEREQAVTAVTGS